MKNLLLATMLTSVAFAGAAHAQTDPAAAPATTAPATTEPATEGAMATDGAMTGAMANEGGFITYQEGSQMLASGLMGADVRGADGESIGSVDDLLLDTDGQIQAVIIGIGGFLGVGQRDVAIANDQLEFVMAQDAAAADGAMAPAGTATTGTATTGTAATDTTTAGTSPATGATGGAMAPAEPATGTGMAAGTGADADARMENDGWGWSGAGIDHIMVNYTREQLENAPEFESAE